MTGSEFMANLHEERLPYIDSASLFTLVAHENWAVMLDSGQTSSQTATTPLNARFDVLAIRPSATLVYHNGNAMYVGVEPSRVPDATNPADLVRALIPRGVLNAQSQDSHYMPGVIGYLSYDLARELEQLPEFARDDEDIPELVAAFYETVLVVDHDQQCCKVITLAGSESALATSGYWKTLIESLRKVPVTGPEIIGDDRPWQATSIEADLTMAEYTERFSRIQEYIRSGDCYQVNFTQQFSAAVEGDAWATYLRLRRLSSAPFGAYLNYEFAKILSNSPERFIQCRAGRVVTSPIKGTRPRDTRSAIDDEKLASALKHSEKDRAENVMIVDLMRNDLSRVCTLNSVKADTLFELHSFANVHHLISHVSGTLNEGFDALDCLVACFPGGSITGAPKIRAMQIIEELEVQRRGVYCGSIFYFGLNGDLETSITIRTMTFSNGTVRFSAGGGLVADSDVLAEHTELMDKASAMIKTISPEVS